MEPRKFSGKTVEEATDNALEALDVNLEDVEIVVVNHGRSGILGFGGEPAEIDVTLLDSDGQDAAGTAGRAFQPEDDDSAPVSDDDDEFDDEPETVEPYAPISATESDQEFDEEEPAQAQPERGRPEPPEHRERPEHREPPESPESPESRERPSEPDPEVIEFASEVIDYFLASMNVVADTYIREDTDDGVPIFDIEGEDSGLLIGRRGETLQSLQYLVNLIVTHQLGRSPYLQLDIGGHKAPRRMAQIVSPRKNRSEGRRGARTAPREVPSASKPSKTVGSSQVIDGG